MKGPAVFLRLQTLVVASLGAVLVAVHCDAAQRFTVRDEIEVAQFVGPLKQEVRFSPDGSYFAVETERGRLDLNRPEDSLRFYRSRDVKDFLRHPEEIRPPLPVWTLTLSEVGKGGSINHFQWLADSSGVAFLMRTANGSRCLVLADLQTKMIEQLTSNADTVSSFDVRDRRHYVYTVVDWASREKLKADLQSSSISGAGRSIYQLLFPDDLRTISMTLSAQTRLWAVIAGKRFNVQRAGVPLVFSNSPVSADVATGADLALSPDGLALVTVLPVSEVPSSWETLYPPPHASDTWRLHAGRQDTQADSSARQYVRIDLRTGSVEALTDAPTSDSAGWWANGNPSWSADGQAILLPGTFLKAKDNAPSRPCVAVVDLLSNTRTCVETLTAPTEIGLGSDSHYVRGAQFARNDRQRVVVTGARYRNKSLEAIEYRRIATGAWQVAWQNDGSLSEGQDDELKVIVKQGLNEPPVLVASAKGASRPIFDPNPHLKDFDLGNARVYTWTDKTGREQKGGLYEPTDHTPGRRYPLVIQTHGFADTVFIPAGSFPTAFAARALAAAGIGVLQIGETCPRGTPSEGPCVVSEYESAASSLVSDGLVDPDRIGIIGFSRTCFYVMETLTTGSVHFRAASITDGILESYLGYLFGADFDGNGLSREYDAMVGARPFSEGLQQWLQRSPTFNLDKVSTPLLIVGEGPLGLLTMWEPYSGLRYLQKPVDLVMLNSDEHVLTNPAVRLASQGGSVDWFRFWLQDYEDPTPAKAEQNERWRALKDGRATPVKQGSVP